MPTITLALQETFDKKELGVVTSSSQFFRSIGGTFGVTVLGAVMNSKSGTLLTNDLVPFLNKLPEQAAPLADKFKDMIDTNPQGVFQMLFNEQTLKMIPSQILDGMLPIVKTSLMESLHSVFYAGLFFIIVGAVFTLFLKQIKLTNRKAEDSDKEKVEAETATS